METFEAQNAYYRKPFYKRNKFKPSAIIISDLIPANLLNVFASDLKAFFYHYIP